MFVRRKSIEIDLTSIAFQSPQYLSLRHRFLSRLEQLPNIKIRDDFIYKWTEYATGDAVQEQNSWKLWVPSDLTADLIKRAHGCIAKTIFRLNTFFYWPKLVQQISDFVPYLCLAFDVCKQTKAQSPYDNFKDYVLIY